MILNDTKPSYVNCILGVNHQHLLYYILLSTQLKFINDFCYCCLQISFSFFIIGFCDVWHKILVLDWIVLFLQ